MLYPTIQYSDLDSSHPESVAVGDFNNDTHIDIVLANSGSDSVGILFGYGNSTFTKQITYSTDTGSAPRMVAVADFNNDHRLDIAVANFGTNNIGIFLGNGNGSFQTQTIFPTMSSRPLCIIIDDFNNDNNPDIAFAGYGTNNIGVLLGLGNGDFETPKTISAGYDSLPNSIATGNFNNDNQLDIVVANSGTDNVLVLLGDGNGSFVMETIYTTGMNSHPYFIAVSDLNNDTQLDIVVVNSKANNLGVFFGYGNGSFTLPDSIPPVVNLIQYSWPLQTLIQIINQILLSLIMAVGMLVYFLDMEMEVLAIQQRIQLVLIRSHTQLLLLISIMISNWISWLLIVKIIM